MKNQALFSSKDKSKKLKCCLLQFLFGALCVNICGIRISENEIHVLAHFNFGMASDNKENIMYICSIFFFTFLLNYTLWHLLVSPH